MMLAVLSYLSCCAEPYLVIEAPTKPTKTAYEVYYMNRDGSKVGTSQDREGYYVAVRVYNDNDKPGKTNFITWDKKKFQ